MSARAECVACCKQKTGERMALTGPEAVPGGGPPGCFRYQMLL
jgi:hypothetical protein